MILKDSICVHMSLQLQLHTQLDKMYQTCVQLVKANKDRAADSYGVMIDMTK